MSEAIHLRRGNKLWEANFILPEQKEALRDLEKEESKVPQPMLDEQELYELGLVAHDSLKHTLDVKVTYWDKGFYKDVVGIVGHIDHQGGRFKLSVGEEYTWVDIDKLSHIERI
ncbi:YolD-like family protein [Alkalihalobacillus trypoxylicola]|uniref:YolD-like family protein n=1 Tax=Alkalihalobacillus trypoxylicola TaxID=519424 RepID=A0A162D5K9_9BACI|nr:YolD-like family protein [Alkalihalobacillus trypoxylicola]KYG28192.1 hypothetical protein AZF04_09830 [Alkalihalobacillus trypoxylicola]